MALAISKPVLYLYGTDTYTAWDTSSLTTITALPAGAASGTGNAAWLQLPILSAPIEYVYPEAEERTGSTYANLRLTSVDIAVELRPIAWDSTTALTLATMLNKRYLYLEQGTYTKPLYTTNSAKCLAVSRASAEMPNDKEYGTIKITLKFRKRYTSL